MKGTEALARHRAPLQDVTDVHGNSWKENT